MNLLAADIGGTNSRLAWISGQQRFTRQYENNKFDDLYQVIDRFREDVNTTHARIKRMVLALAAPVDRSPVRLTNLDWEIDPDKMQQRHPCEQLLLVNDFQAAAVGVLRGAGHVQLNPRASIASSGPAIVTGVGTGLGLTWLADITQAALPHPTEGGHADFAPQDRQQCELHTWLQRHYTHVSYERVLSGDGLGMLYRFLSNDEAAPAAADIHAAAKRGDAVAVEVVELFVRILGAYVGNLALLFNPAAGIYVCGGVVGHLAGWLDERFLEAFYAKGRMRRIVEKVPLFLAAEGETGLHGAIKIAEDDQIK